MCVCAYNKVPATIGFGWTGLKSQALSLAWRRYYLASFSIETGLDENTYY